MQAVINAGGQMQLYQLFNAYHKAEVINDLNTALIDLWDSDPNTKAIAERKWSAYRFQNPETGRWMSRTGDYLFQRPIKTTHDEDSFYGDLLKLYPIIQGITTDDTHQVRRKMLNIINRWSVQSPHLNEQQGARQPSLRHQLLQEYVTLGYQQGLMGITVNESQEYVGAIITRLQKIEKESKTPIIQHYCYHVLEQWKLQKENPYFQEYLAGHAHPPLWIFLNFLDRVNTEMVNAAQKLTKQGLTLFGVSNQGTTEKQKPTQDNSSKPSSSSSSSKASKGPKRWEK